MIKKYQSLIDYYKDCFSIVDEFHFNSEVTRDTYRKYIVPKEEKIIPITHNGINDHRRKKSFEDNCLKIGFVGSAAPYKGLSRLIMALKQLNRNDKWRLDVWGDTIGQDESLPIYYRGKFTHSAIEMVYTTMDIMVVPSLCHETFGLVTLEALSYGVPVLVSDTVGAKDIVKEYDSKFVFHSDEELVALLEQLVDDKSLLRNYNEAIISNDWRHSMSEHAQEIIEELYN